MNPFLNYLKQNKTSILDCCLLYYAAFCYRLLQFQPLESLSRRTKKYHPILIHGLLFLYAIFVLIVYVFTKTFAGLFLLPVGLLFLFILAIVQGFCELIIYSFVSGVAEIFHISIPELEKQDDDFDCWP